MKSCPDYDTLAAYCDGEDCIDHAIVERHVQTCADCANQVAEIDLINRAVRQAGQSVSAPANLVRWIETRDRPRGFAALTGRRRFVAAASMAAGLGAVGLFMAFPGGRPSIAPTLFDDYSTSLAADRAMDLRASDFGTVLAWFETRVPFAVPQMPQVASVGVRGARLCWLLDRRVAAVHLGEEDVDSCLYMADLGGLTLDGEHDIPSRSEPALLTDGIASGAFWRSEQLAFGLIASTSTAEISNLMRRINPIG